MHPVRTLLLPPSRLQLMQKKVDVQMMGERTPLLLLLLVLLVLLLLLMESVLQMLLLPSAVPRGPLLLLQG